MTGTAAIVAGWNARLAELEREPLPASIPALLSRQARDDPDRVLLDFFESGERLTRRELDRTSAALAAGMRARGIGPGDHVAIMLPNGPAWHPTWLAALRLGAAVVPVNPSYTARELAYVLGDAEAVAWFVPGDRLDDARTLAATLPALAPERVWGVADRGDAPSDWRALLDAGVARLDAGEAAPGDGPDGPTQDTLANLQYTSGTTGFPKGCMLTHGYWLQLARAVRPMHVAPMTRFFTAQPFFYMDPFWQLLMAAGCGGTLVAARRISATRFLGWLADERIEWAQLPELATKSADTVDGRELALKQVFTFGWDAAARLEFESRFGVRALESFGMTEIGLGLAMPVDLPVADKPTSVGIPAAGREARIVDAGGRPVPPGTVGELQIRGRHLFRGYWRKPEVNAAAFVDGWFRTGDAFVQDADGFYRIVGRFKDMIRRSSENIAAREVEAVVRGLPEVLDCAAVPVPDPVRTEEVKIMVQLVPDARSDGRPAIEALPVDRLLAHCAANLAPFKVPRYVQYVDDFPRTSSNKIAKHLILQDGADPRAGAWDRVDGCWR